MERIGYLGVAPGIHDANHEAALALAGPERLRVWRLYLRAARNGFRSGFTSVYQVRARV